MDFIVGAVCFDLRQAFVNRFAQTVVAAFFEGETVVFFNKGRIDNGIEFGVRVLFHIIRHHAAVAHHRVHAAAFQFFKRQRHGFETLDVLAVFALQILQNQIARCGSLHRSRPRFQIGKRFDVCVAVGGDNHLRGFKIRVGEIQLLFALVIDGDAGQADIAVAFVHIGKQAFKRRIDKFQLHILAFGRRVQNIVRKADNGIVFHIFHRRIRCIGGYNIGFVHVQSRGLRAGCRRIAV